MADYYSPTVVAPEIPLNDMTQLERLILSGVFDEDVAPGTAYFHSECGPGDILTIDAGRLRAALAQSLEIESPCNGRIASLLNERDASTDDLPDGVDIDLTEVKLGWDQILQAIVKRSTGLDEIVVTAAFTCSKMRSDGFGGSVMRITADRIQYASTVDMLETMWNDAAIPTDGGHETRTRLETAADTAGWDSFTLLLLISRWLDNAGHSEAVIRDLGELAAAGDTVE